MAASQFTYRCLAGLQVCQGPPINDFQSGFEKPTNVKVFQYSPCGSLLAWTTGDGIKIVDAETGNLIREIVAKGVADLGWSPKARFLSSWERYVKPVEENDTHKNLRVWSVETGEQVTAFTLKQQQSNWNVKWTDDEKFCARLVSGEVQLFDSKDWNKVHSRLKLENMSDFSISPGPNPSVAAFVPEKKGQPACIKLYSIFNLNNPIASKTFFKAEKCTWYWNQLGTGVLVLTQTEVGDNYYGETALYYLATAGNYDCRVALEEQGPVHDLTWSPSSREFIVIYGKMPARATLFDNRANPMYDFPRNHRNFVRFNPQGRLICMAGFGNLAGDMDFYDRATFKKISSVHAPNSSVADWSPCGRFLLTATCTPRLRVDNGYRIWHYQGVVVGKQDIHELYSVAWRPRENLSWPDKRPLSPPPAAVTKPIGGGEAKVETPTPPVATKPAGRYVPPGARGRSEAPSKTTSGTLPGLAGLEQRLAQGSGLPGSGARVVPGSAAYANGKKRQGTSPNPPQNHHNHHQSAPAVMMPVFVGQPMAYPAMQNFEIPGVDSERQKRLRTVQKKLREIEELKLRIASGHTLELTQIKKVEREAEFLQEMQQILHGIQNM